jgi:hypothetical protein
MLVYVMSESQSPKRILASDWKFSVTRSFTGWFTRPVGGYYSQRPNGCLLEGSIVSSKISAHNDRNLVMQWVNRDPLRIGGSTPQPSQ